MSLRMPSCVNDAASRFASRAFTSSSIRWIVRSDAGTLLDKGCLLVGAGAHRRAYRFWLPARLHPPPISSNSRTSPASFQPVHARWLLSPS